MNFHSSRVTHGECEKKKKEKKTKERYFRFDFIINVLASAHYSQRTLFISYLPYGTYYILFVVYSMPNCVHVLCAFKIIWDCKCHGVMIVDFMSI